MNLTLLTRAYLVLKVILKLVLEKMTITHFAEAFLTLYFFSSRIIQWKKIKIRLCFGILVNDNVIYTYVMCM